jgi:hypothetical protein
VHTKHFPDHIVSIYRCRHLESLVWNMAVNSSAQPYVCKFIYWRSDNCVIYIPSLNGYITHMFSGTVRFRVVSEGTATINRNAESGGAGAVLNQAQVRAMADDVVS